MQVKTWLTIFVRFGILKARSRRRGHQRCKQNIQRIPQWSTCQGFTTKNLTPGVCLFVNLGCSPNRHPTHVEPNQIIVSIFNNELLLTWSIVKVRELSDKLSNTSTCLGSSFDAIRNISITTCLNKCPAIVTQKLLFWINDPGLDSLVLLAVLVVTRRTTIAHTFKN